MSTSWFGHNLADGQRAMTIRRDVLHRSILRTVMAGLQEGVPAELLDGYRAFEGLSGMVTLNAAALESTASKLRSAG